MALATDRLNVPCNIRAPVAWALALAMIVAGFAAPALLNQPYALNILIVAITYAIPAVGLNIVLGYAGLISLGHMAFAGVGGYCAAALMVDFHMGFWPALLAGTALAGVLGVVIGATCLHLRGHFFIIVTLAAGMILFTVFNNWDSVTRGAEGFPGIPRPGPLNLFGVMIDFRRLEGFYYLSFALLVVVMAINAMIVRSDFGRTLNAIRQDEPLAIARGVNIAAYKIAAFGIGSAMAGLGGVLKVSFLRVAAPLSFDLNESVNLALIVISGGAGYQLGPMLGSLLFIGIPEYLRVARAYRLVIFGAILVLMTLFLPRGLAGLIDDAMRRIAGRGKNHAA
jgi:branched-chain amino acid transport system permease protein